LNFISNEVRFFLTTNFLLVVNAVWNSLTASFFTWYGTLELDENKLKAADISQVKKLFTGEDGFAKKVSNLSGQIGKYAKEKVTELEKSSAQASSNYNRYARYANNSQSYNSSYYNNSYYNSKA
jgi:flagellar capping protein FliD